MRKCPFCGSENFENCLELKDYFLSQEEFEIARCNECGLLYTIPRPPSDKLGDYYKSEDYLSHKENKHGFVPRIYEFVKSINLNNKLKIATKGLSCGNILDIGCGVGDFLLRAKKAGWGVEGVEPSEEAKLIAEKKLDNVVHAPSELSSFQNLKYDVITMWHVLEHVEDLMAEICHLHRLLKPGGRLVIAVPNYKSYDAIYYKDKWAAWDVPRHLSHFDAKTIKKVFSAYNDLKINKITTLAWDSYYISYLSEKFLSHKMPLLRGIFRGMLSNLKAKGTGEYSTLVYVFEKKLVKTHD